MSGEDCFDRIRSMKENLSPEEYDALVDSCVTDNYSDTGKRPVQPKSATTKPLYVTPAPPPPPVYKKPPDDYFNSKEDIGVDPALIGIIGGGTVLGVAVIAGATVLGVAGLGVLSSTIPSVANTTYTRDSSGNITGQQTTIV